MVALETSALAVRSGECCELPLSARHVSVLGHFDFYASRILVFAHTFE
jgi:hypothetical protein